MSKSSGREMLKRHKALDIVLRFAIINKEVRNKAVIYLLNNGDIDEFFKALNTNAKNIATYVHLRPKRFLKLDCPLYVNIDDALVEPFMDFFSLVQYERKAAKPLIRCRREISDSSELTTLLGM